MVFEQVPGSSCSLLPLKVPPPEVETLPAAYSVRFPS